MLEQNERFQKRIIELLEENLKKSARVEHGHPQFYKFVDDLKELHNRKNKGYAGGGRPLGNFERSAAIMALYPNFRVDSPIGTALMFTLKHLDAIFWACNIGNLPPDDSLRDVSVYMNIIRCIIYDENNKPITATEINQVTQDFRDEKR